MLGWPCGFINTCVCGLLESKGRYYSAFTVWWFLSGEVYAIGGYNGVKTVDVVEKYNPEDGTWKEVSPLVFGRSVPGIAVAHLWPVQSTMKSFWEPESQL